MPNRKTQTAETMCLWFSQHPSVYLTSQKTEQIVFVQQDKLEESDEIQLPGKVDPNYQDEMPEGVETES